MNNITMQALIAQDEYQFLRENEHLKKRMLFLTLGGSHAYGTNTPSSDVDVRGVALNRPSDLLGLTNFEQFVNADTDTTVYSFNKLISLLLNCNPNTIEILGCKPEHYILYHPIGQMLIDNCHMFLSQRAANSFGGYATAQLRRLENALARDKLPQIKREEHIMNSMKNAMRTFADRYTAMDEGSIRLYKAPTTREGFDEEIYADIHLDHYPAREFGGILHDLNDVTLSYDKIGKRNHKKDDEHLNKHAMHLIRLYLMGIDIFEKEKVITYRADDLPLLMSIRRGDYQNEDGTYRSEFFDILHELETRMDYALKQTSLPVHPDMKQVEEFVMYVNKEALNE